MNDHLPPPQRSIPAHERSAMRDRIRQVTGPAPTRSTRPRSRLLAPTLAAAATLAVVSVGGYASLGDSDGSRGSGFASDGSTPPGANEQVPYPPAPDEQVPQECTQATLVPGPDGGWRDRSGPGQASIDAVPERDLPPVDGDEQVPDDEGGQASGDPFDKEAGSFGCAGTVTLDAAPPTATVVADPAGAYARCDELVAESFPEAGPTAGRIAIEDDRHTAVVVTADSSTYVCHIGPEESEVAATSGDARAQDDVHTTGQRLWAGGRIPEDVIGMGFGFGEGPSHRAVLHDGWWALLATQEDPIAGAPMQWSEASPSAGGGVSGSIGVECQVDEPGC